MLCARLLASFSIATFFAAAALAQEVTTEPPVVGGPPKVDFLKELGLPGLGGNQQGDKVTFFGSFTIQKGSRRGELTVAATIAPEWHIYSITQPKGGTQATRLEPKLPPGVKLT